MISLFGRLHLTRGPLLLLAFQVAPIEVRPTEDGTGYRLTFAAGGGQYESRTLNCAGDVEAAEAHPVTAAGVTADVWPSPDFRISAGAGQHRDGGTDGALAGGIQFAVERPKVGAGFGASFDGHESQTASYYLRLGRRDRAHFRLDAAQPDGTGPLLGQRRAGLAWNQAPGTRSYGFVGWSEGVHSDAAYGGGVFAELGVPVTGRVALLLGGAYHPSAVYRDATAKVGLSISGE